LSAAPIIAVTHLIKRFGSVIAVNDLSFSVTPGQIFGLLGPNGAGKTTTIQMLLGLITPTAGQACLFGLDVRTHRRAVLQRVNFSSAYVSLPTNLSVWENLWVFARLYGIRKPQKKIAALLELFEMSHVTTTVTGALSSGQLSRLHLCKAFINDPAILFLDEPTASLDPDIAVKVRATLRQMQRERGVTIIYTSHNMREIEHMCDEVLFLARGQAVTQGSPPEVIARTRTASLEEVFIRIARDGRVQDIAEARESD
jgi:ABC-2 type transport system ATP-binding protein